MKITSARLVTLSLAMACGLALPSPALADGDAGLHLSANTFDVEAGQEFTVDVLIENAPEVYGIDVQLGFDPAVLQVVDADENTDGIQLTTGSFFDAAQSFFLQNTADNTNGTIDLAMTLLNPAPPVTGDGLLCQITFEAVAAGHTTVSIKDGLFGTRTGETIAPSIEGREVAASDVSGIAALGSSGEQSAKTGAAAGPQAIPATRVSVNAWLILGLVVLFAVGIAVGYHLARRRLKITDG